MKSNYLLDKDGYVIVEFCDDVLERLSTPRSKDPNGRGILNDDPKDLIRDYNRWLITQARMDTIRSLIVNTNLLYEATNILERWLLSCINLKLDPWSTLPGDILLQNAEPTKKMIAEFKQKRVFAAGREDAITKNIIYVLPNRVGTKVDVAEPKFNGKTITYGMYKTGPGIPLVKIDALIKKVGLDQTAAMCMRYDAIISGSQQWMVPAKIYKTIKDRFDIQIEGFASPINSQIVNLGGNFCSIFPEDKIFGSIGNFWDLNLTNKRIIINSPFVEAILERVADKLILEKPKLAFVVAPSWFDAKFYKKLESFATKKILLAPKEHSYENVKGDNIVARFGSTWFILGDSDINKSLFV
jgi:hypothetical protein